ncbi:MAG: SCP2 sterol-binding domain-containing protein [Actinomycetota bacterium]
MSKDQTPQASEDGGADRAPDLTAVSAEEFAALIANASDEQLAEAMSGPQRETVLPEIFSRMAEHLDPAKAKGHDAVVHFQILDRPDGGYDEFELIVHDGKCDVSETPSEEARVTLKVNPVGFLKLITNQASGPGLFMTGKLKIEGDLMYAPQIASLFRVPTAPKQEGSN